MWVGQQSCQLQVTLVVPFLPNPVHQSCQYHPGSNGPNSNWVFKALEFFFKALISLDFCFKISSKTQRQCLFIYLFLNFYCYSITVVCLFSPSLHPTPPHVYLFFKDTIKVILSCSYEYINLSDHIFPYILKRLFLSP